MVDLAGEIPERAPVDYPVPFLGERNRPAVSDVWMALRKAAADSRIRAAVLEPRNLAIGWAKMEEFHAGLQAFRNSGKPLIAYLKTPGSREYYLATAAERVYLSPEDMLDLKGMRFELMFFKNTLDKIGIEVQIEHAGKYKDFGEMFTRTGMTPESREAIEAILNGLYGDLVSRVAAGRKKTDDEVRAIIDQGPFLSVQAREHGLVDDLKYEDELDGELRKLLSVDEVKRVRLRDYVKVPARSVGLGGGPRVALVIAEGAITRGSSGGDGLGGEGLESESFNKTLRKVREDSRVRGVIVRIDSPGGEMFASDAIWREMNLLSQKKPTVISMGTAAASGGYYIAMTGDPIVAYPGTLTGSIGVVFGKPSLRGLYGRLGITKDILSRGRFAMIDSDYKPLNEAELQKLRQGIDQHYRDFVQKVAQARKKPFEQIEPVAQGRAWLGMHAKQQGLIDEFGGYDRALELVKTRAGIPKAERVTLVTYPPRRSALELLFGSERQSFANLFGADRKSLSDLVGFDVRPWLNSGYLRMMPYSITIQ
jgi:protease-4